MSEQREGCCATWPKPCSYHEGYQDGIDSRNVEIAELTQFRTAWVHMYSFIKAMEALGAV